jgi:hypothetical protein
MTSGGQINISGLAMVDAWQALTSTPNLHVLTNGEYRQDYIERLANELDLARVLFASFAPVLDPPFRSRGSARPQASADRAAGPSHAPPLGERRAATRQWRVQVQTPGSEAPRAMRFTAIPPE